jgi:hypothetical protein
MKSLRQVCAASVLTLMLALSAFAGEITTMVVSPQPPPSQQSTTQGQMDTGIAGEIDTPFQAALSLLQSVLSLI